MSIRFSLASLLGVVLVSASVGGSLAAQEPTRQLDIVDRAIAFHGGDAYTSSTTRMTISSRSGRFDLAVRRSEGLFEYSVEGQTSNGLRRAQETNESIEEWRDGSPRELDEEGARRARSFVASRIYFPFLPYGLNDPSVWKTDQGLETWDGRELHRVKVTFDPGSSPGASDEYLYWFDPESGQLVYYAYSFDTGTEEAGLRFRKALDYRRVGGLLFFDVINLGIEGDPALNVDMIDPEFVESRLREVSVVRLSDIEVEGLGN